MRGGGRVCCHVAQLKKRLGGLSVTTVVSSRPSMALPVCVTGNGNQCTQVVEKAVQSIQHGLPLEWVAIL